jgi:septum site-determining protein MinC
MAKGKDAPFFEPAPSPIVAGVGVTLLRGKWLGLEIVLAGRDLDEALEELDARLLERPGFYRGTRASAVFGATAPGPGQYERLLALLEAAGIEFAGAETQPVEELEQRRAQRPRREFKLSDSARGLVADFAGARADIAGRRARGEPSVPRVEPEAVRPAALEPAPPALHVVEPIPGTLYHAGTLRGGQALHHAGNIVVVGDINPGAELVATGDILVFGRLAGVAHAGAQGETSARVYALELVATQLRIATFIAADAEGSAGASRPEVALVRDGRIAVVAFDQLDSLGAFAR